MTSNQWPKGRPHPSGKPVRRTKYVERGRYRIPRDEFLTPRLNSGSLPSAIGFHVHCLPGQQRDSDDDFEC